MKEYHDDFISNLRGKFQDDKKATIKHLIETGYSEKEATEIADHIQGQIKDDEEAHKENMEEDFITSYKCKFGPLSDTARKTAFGKMPENKERVNEILNELIDLIPTLSNREHPGLYIIWLSIIGAVVEKDKLDQYMAVLFSTAGLHIVNLRKFLDTPAEIKVVKVT